MHLLLSFSTLLTAALALPVSVTLESRAPPNIPSGSQAAQMLENLTLAPSGSSDGYSRELFPHWGTVSGTCNARETVLKRDGSGVTTDSECRSTSGSWRSPYDGRTWTSAADIQIDHMVPLANAWRSGANAWTTTRRRQFANDLNTPQLWAVTGSVNNAKSDSSPDEWKPPLTSFHCTYASSWIGVKDSYQLTITSSEKIALSNMLRNC